MERLRQGVFEVKPLEVMTELVTLSGNGSLYDAYPVLAWHLTNIERKFLQPQDVASNIIPVCEALLLSAELTHFILSKVSGRLFQVREIHRTKEC